MIHAAPQQIYPPDATLFSGFAKIALISSIWIKFSRASLSIWVIHHEKSPGEIAGAFNRAPWPVLTGRHEPGGRGARYSNSDDARASGGHANDGRDSDGCDSDGRDSDGRDSDVWNGDGANGDDDAAAR